MSTVILPTRTDGAQRFSYRVALGSINPQTYGLEYFWNERDQSWSFTISDSAGTLLFSKKITVGTPLTWRYGNARLPKGEFLAIDTSNQDLDPGLTDFGSRVLFTFTDVADLP